MNKIIRILGIMLALILFANVVAAAKLDLEILIPESGEEYELANAVEIIGLVENNGGELAKDVSFSGEIDVVGVVDSEKKDIGQGTKENITFTIVGWVWTPTPFTLTACGKGETSEEEDCDSVRIRLYPPDLGLSMIYPQNEIHYRSLPEPTSIELDVKVKNTGKSALFGVRIEVETREGNVSCYPGDPIDIDRGALGEIPLNCYNFTSGDRVVLTARDQHNATKDVQSVLFYLDPRLSAVRIKLEGLENGSNMTLEPGGNELAVTVRNVGNGTAVGVCVTVDPLEMEPASCSDIGYGETQDYVLNITVPAYTVDMDVIAFSSDNLTRDVVSIRMVGAPIDTPVNISPAWLGNETPPGWVANLSGPGNPDVDTGGGGTGDEDQSVFNTDIMVVIAVITILIAYIAIGLSRKTRRVPIE
jgi:hypothetical protein